MKEEFNPIYGFDSPQFVCLIYVAMIELFLILNSIHFIAKKMVKFSQNLLSLTQGKKENFWSEKKLRNLHISLFDALNIPHHHDMDGITCGKSEILMLIEKNFQFVKFSFFFARAREIERTFSSIFYSICMIMFSRKQSVSLNTLKKRVSIESFSDKIWNAMKC